VGDGIVPVHLLKEVTVWIMGHNWARPVSVLKDHHCVYLSAHEVVQRSGYGPTSSHTGLTGPMAPSGSSCSRLRTAGSWGVCLGRNIFYKKTKMSEGMLNMNRNQMWSTRAKAWLNVLS